VLKNHVVTTADRAQLAMNQVPGIEVWGGIVLNKAVGGINPAAVEWMHRMSGGRGKVVWLPTFDSDKHIKTLVSKDGSGLVVAPGGKVTAEMEEVLKIVARENATGTLGTFESPVVVPDLSKEGMKVSSVVVGTQLRRGPPRARTLNPLIRDGVELIPSLTHVVGRAQRLYFYYEVYEPAVDAQGAPRLKTSLAFYRGRVKVFETPIVERTESASRGAPAVFQFEVDAASLKPGLYTCQVNIIDEHAARFAFPRLALYVR
jgi:hypothetical protein